MASYNDAEEKDVDVDDSTVKIFADESDDNDYDYGAGSNDAAADDDTAFGNQMQRPSAGTTGFDPTVLSQPSADLDWDGVWNRLSSLLDELSYDKLEPLSSVRWKALECSETLGNLSLFLLRSDNEEGGPGGSGGRRRPTASLRSLWTKPLAALRDRALDGSKLHDAKEGYLKTLRTMISSSSSSSGPLSPLPGAKTRDVDVRTATGLAYLSSLCLSDELLQSDKSSSARSKLSKAKA